MYGPSGVFPREILKSRRSQRASILHFEFTHRNYAFLKSQSPHLQSYKLIDVAHVSYHIKLLTVSTPHRLRLLTISDSLPSQTISDKLGTIRDSLPYMTPYHLRLLSISDSSSSQTAYHLRSLTISDSFPSQTAHHLRPLTISDSFPSQTPRHLRPLTISDRSLSQTPSHLRPLTISYRFPSKTAHHLILLIPSQIA